MTIFVLCLALEPLYVYPNYPQLPEGYQFRPLYSQEHPVPVPFINLQTEATPLLPIRKYVETGEKEEERKPEEGTNCFVVIAQIYVSVFSLVLY